MFAPHKATRKKQAACSTTSIPPPPLQPTLPHVAHTRRGIHPKSTHSRPSSAAVTAVKNSHTSYCPFFRTQSRFRAAHKTQPHPHSHACVYRGRGGAGAGRGEGESYCREVRYTTLHDTITRNRTKQNETEQNRTTTNIFSL